MKRLRVLGAAPVFPAVLILGGMMLGLAWKKILLLGLLALGLTVLCAVLLYPRQDPAVPTGWHRDLRLLKKRVERIKNRSIYRGGHDILTELKQCESSLPFLSQGARREITEYYLPTFLKYFTAYATFEECNEGNPSVLATMSQMEQAMEEIAANFRKACDKNDRTASLNINAETALLYKKLNHKE
ncbi:MAG: hypothetical protein J6B54_05035 [Clostridia bacterium]|nr:hypothetical protein [Clostridia bacterium]